MLVHFASGTHPFKKPWVNVDMYAERAQVQADLTKPLHPSLAGIEIAYVGHFLEHIDPEDGMRFLTRVRRRMVPGGRLVVVGPDVEKAHDMALRGRIPWSIYEACVAHEADHPGASHVWDCTGLKVLHMVQSTGWSFGQEIPMRTFQRSLPDVPCIDAAEWQFCVTALAPGENLS